MDFLLEEDARITPLEVKSGKDYDRHRALNNIMDYEPYRLSEAIILTCKNVEIMGRFTYLPVYMLMFIEKHSVRKDMIYTIDIPKLGTN